MLKFYRSLALDALRELYVASDNLLTAIAVIAFGIGLLVNPEAGKLVTSTWEGVSRWWAALPLSFLFAYGLMRANYARFTTIERRFKETLAAQSAQHTQEVQQQPQTRRRGILLHGVEGVHFVDSKGSVAGDGIALEAVDSKDITATRSSFDVGWADGMQRVSADQGGSQQRRLVDLVDANHKLRGKTFENLILVGPGVIFACPHTIFDECNFPPPVEALLWELAPSQSKLTGAVDASDCVFRGCTFENIGITGLPSQIQATRRAVNGESDR